VKNTRLALLALSTVLVSPALADQSAQDLEKVSSIKFESEGFVPTPKMAVSLKMSDDSKKWKMGFGHGNPLRIIMELVPEGEVVESWNELSTNIILFDIPVEIYLKRWKEGMESAGAKIVKEETLSDGSFLVAYSSPDENGLWRYFQGPDGIYGVSYQTRPSTEDPVRLKIWDGIIRKASLAANPNSAKNP